MLIACVVLSFCERSERIDRKRRLLFAADV